MQRHEFGYFIHEGVNNLFSHGFMSFAAVGITVACLLIMGTFSLVAYNAEMLLKTLESEYEILAFVDDSCTPAQTKAVGEAIAKLPNVKDVEFITRQEAMEAFEERSLDEYMRRNILPEMFRDRYAVYVQDLNLARQTASAVENVEGIGKGNVRVDEDIAGGFILVRNVAGAVSVALIAILLVVSVFIISNTIRLTTFDRRDEIAIMKMVGATNGFIRWPFVYEGFFLGLLSSMIAFGLQWLVYATVAKSIGAADTLQFLRVVPFHEIWKPVALSFGAAGMLIGVGGSLTAIRKFLQV
ncbi:MAG: ABC transporter permease [Ruminococcaceae bacterium]|jgi:cell division transport system permease protein|nr:ABC transporter permease [Oscillospiraceae bacterium]